MYYSQLLTISPFLEIKNTDNEKQKRNDDIWANSGFGLYTVSEICKKLGGNFCIISYGNYVFVDAENTQIDITSFSGNL